MAAAPPPIHLPSLLGFARHAHQLQVELINCNNCNHFLGQMFSCRCQDLKESGDSKEFYGSIIIDFIQIKSIVVETLNSIEFMAYATYEDCRDG